MHDRRDTRPLELRCFPDRDEEFRADVQAAIARSRATINDGRRLMEAVRGDLAARYPAIVIRERDELAELGSGDNRWDVYRDGRIARIGRRGIAGPGRPSASENLSRSPFVWTDDMGWLTATVTDPELDAAADEADGERRAAFLVAARPALDRSYRLAGLLLGNATEAEDAVQD